MFSVNMLTELKKISCKKLEMCPLETDAPGKDIVSIGYMEWTGK